MIQPETKIKIAIVDDHNLFRQGLTLILGLKANFSISFEAENGKKLLEKLALHPTDVIMLDLDMPVMTGYEAMEIIKVKYPEVKVLALSFHTDEITIARIIEKGANGYLAKDDSADLVYEAIEAVYEKDFYFTKNIKAILQKFELKAKQLAKNTSTPDFTKREIEIIDLICKEYSSKAIADKLNTSKRTIDWHRANIIKKTNTKNNAGLVLFAVQNSLFGYSK